MLLKILIFFLLFIIIRKFLKVGFFVYTAKKQMDEMVKHTQRQYSQKSEKPSKGTVIEADFKVISEE